ncbi:ferredoxin [Pseudonocardia ailaonensis]|uniref:Ferredoxin n=1 Tax=Pseudonocardia ailaonensis TaxID=367279 RepID=A0ABN2MYU8_9PSEU
MKVSVDFDACDGHGFCAEICPEVFAILDDGGLSLLQESVEETSAGRLGEAERVCPTQAITVLAD